MTLKISTRNISNNILFAMVILILSTSFLYGKDKDGFLKISGKSIEEGFTIKNYTINLYQENTIIKTINVRKSFELILKENSHYTLEVIKEGYFPKRISIDTKIERILDQNETYEIDFDAIVHTITDYQDSYYFDFPAALIKFNSNEKYFEINQKYAEHIQEKINSNQNSYSLMSGNKLAYKVR